MKSATSTIITSSSPLLPPSPSSIPSFSPISKYNEVIEFYNNNMRNQANQERKLSNDGQRFINKNSSEIHENSNLNLSVINDENVFLKKIPQSRLYEKMMFPLMAKKWKILFLSLFLLLVPIWNFIFLGFFIYVYYFFTKCKKIWQENEEKVGDIFKEMIFAPELCAKMRKNYYRFEIEIEELDGLCLNLEAIYFIKANNKEGKVCFIIYNNEFWSDYHDFPKIQKYNLLWIIYVFLLTVLNLAGISLLVAFYFNLPFFLEFL